MSFFKEFKEDITQAVNELIPDGQAEDTNEATEEETDELVNTLDEEPTQEELDVNQRSRSAKLRAIVKI